MNPIISVKHLTKIFYTGSSKTYAVNDVDCDIESGEFCAITGRSGCGKSTLLTMIAGIERATAGTITVKGKPIHRFNEDQLVLFRLLNIGFVFQSFHLFEYMTVSENIAFPLMIRGVTHKMRQKKAAELIERLGLVNQADHFPSELSGGQQQRASIARAIINEPSIILADEPTGNLDSENAAEIIDLFEEINRGGTTVIMVTHDNQIAARCSRNILLSDGKIVG